MQALIERLQAATEGSRHLDADIAQAVGLSRQFKGFGCFACEYYTTSLDAALTLVPEERTFALLSYPNGTASAGISPNNDDAPYLCGKNGKHEEYATPALALSIAALKAREAE